MRPGRSDWECHARFTVAFQPPAAARLLAELIGRPAVAETCRLIAQRSTDPRRLEAACEAICSLGPWKFDRAP